MRMAEGELLFPVPWATTNGTSAVGSPERYKRGFGPKRLRSPLSTRSQDFALAYFANQKARSLGLGVAGALGLHTLMGEKRQDQIRAMIACISTGIIAPCKVIARKI